MNNRISQLQLAVLNRFQEALVKKSESDLTLKLEDAWKTPLMTRIFDIVIYKGVHPQAVIEVSLIQENKNVLAKNWDKALSALTITNARYAIVTDNEIFYLYDRQIQEQYFNQVSFETIVDKLISPHKVIRDDISITSIINIFRVNADKYLNENKELRDLIDSKTFFNHLMFDADSYTYCFSRTEGSLNSFERRFFDALFGRFNGLQICRYTSLSTAFTMLNYLSYRLSGLVGMNDKTEVNYVDTYMNGVETPLSKLHHKSITALNSRYITSCATFSNKDNLTLWRLYGDDSQGVCLVFDVLPKNLSNNVILNRVFYADRNGTHLILEFLRDVKNAIEALTGSTFEFHELRYFKHFFKPHDYSIENEVRLLIIDSDQLPRLRNEWVLTHSHSIANPTIDFQLNGKRFPIKLRQIILGPKCPEQETNMVQLQEMIRRKKHDVIANGLDSDLKNVTIDISKIRHYR